MHILFASTSVVLAFRRRSGNILGAIIIGMILPAIFCTASDALVPYWGISMFGLNVHFHWCFGKHFFSVYPFLVGGIVAGLILSHNRSKNLFIYSMISHVSHSLVSSMASLFYLVGFGFNTWHKHLGLIFVVLLFAVVVPCLLSDLIVPSLCADFGKSFCGHSLTGEKSDCCDR